MAVIDDDMPELSKRLAVKEPAYRRTLTADLQALRDGTDLAAWERIFEQVGGPGISDAAIRGACPYDAWISKLEDVVATFAAEAFLIGARVGGEAAGLATKEPHPVFNRVNPEAVAWAHQHAGIAIVEIGDATLAGIRASVATALELGWHPTKLARLIRETIGLTQTQATAVTRFAEKIAGGEAELSDAQLFGRVGRYAEAQRRVRALTIARTELAEAASAGQQRLWDTAIETGAIDKSRLRKTWLATYDELLESRCELLASEEVGVDEPFSNGRLGPPDHPRCRCAAGLVRAEKSIVATRPVRIAAPDHDWDAIISEAIRDGFINVFPEPPREM